MNDVLEKLRDIHPPDAVSWWPPGPGWWMLLALIAGAGLLLWRLRRNRAQFRMRELAIGELERIENSFARLDDERMALEHLSMLLRRVAISRYPRERVASLTGRRWLEFLDGVTGGVEFRDGPGRVLAEAPYNPAATADIPDLIELCRRWLDAEFRRKGENPDRGASREVTGGAAPGIPKSRFL